MTVSDPRRDDVRAAPSAADEPALLQRLRDGEDAAFGELFELHAAAVRRLALSLADDPAEADDIVAETFFRVLQALRRGAGPRDNVRAYLLTVARRVSWEWHGARRDVPVTDDELTTRAGAGADSQTRAAEHSLISRAFSSLPERWRSVLWQTEVEGEQPAVVAPHFGLSPNATAALARRARLGLRAAYLQAHLAVNRSSDGCRTVVEKLGGYTAGSVTGAEARKIRAHLLVCPSCRSTQAELKDVCAALRVHASALVALVPVSALAIGTVSGTGAVGTSAIGTGAAGAAAAAGTGAASAGGIALAVGTKAKVGLALASTAAVGAFGAAVGPTVFDPSLTWNIGLPGRGSAELRIGEPPPVPETSVVIGQGRSIPGHLPEPRATPVDRQPPANEYRPPAAVELPRVVNPADLVPGGSELPGTSTTMGGPSSTPGSPRIDPSEPGDDEGDENDHLVTTPSGSPPRSTPSSPGRGSDTTRPRKILPTAAEGRSHRAGTPRAGHLPGHRVPRGHRTVPHLRDAPGDRGRAPERDRSSTERTR
ncbi:sigma-70 family RNA polymerase sigma factor [Amycolatopsis arida]|nr:sigma-70 family RNA polymerase sigma factor [Amycolatopsis arida]